MIRLIGLTVLGVIALSTQVMAQISPNWQSSPVLRKPGSPSPADLFRHKCPPRMAWNPRYRAVHACPSGRSLWWLAMRRSVTSFQPSSRGVN
jgi:hypothetical protein